MLGTRRPGGRGQEALALLARQVFPAFRIDELDDALGHVCTGSFGDMTIYRIPAAAASVSKRRSGVTAGWSAGCR